jgi:TPR repeat protein
MNIYNKANICYEDENYDNAFKSYILFMEEHKIYDDYSDESYQRINNILNNETLSENTLKWIKTESKENTTAQFYYGVMYYYGYMVKKNITEAKYWIYESAEHGNAEAQFNLSMMYNPECTEYDVYTRNLSQDKFGESCYLALVWCRKSAIQGNINAMGNLSDMYCNDLYGIRDIKKGMYWLHKSVESGNIRSLYDLGLKYLFGTHVETDCKKGFELILSCAKDGLQDAYYFLGTMYEKKIYVEQDYKIAIGWYRKITTEVAIGWSLDDLLDKESLQSEADFNIMNNTLGKIYAFPQTVRAWLRMDGEYYDKILHDTFKGDTYIPKEVLNVISSLI